MTEIILHQAVQETPGANRQTLVAAIKAGSLKSSSESPPWMVELADVQAWVAANPDPTVTSITWAAFVARFTPEEQVTIASNPQSLVWWLNLMDIPMVNLADTLVVTTMAALVTSGVLTTERKDIILAH